VKCIKDLSLCTLYLISKPLNHRLLDLVKFLTDKIYFCVLFSGKLSDDLYDILLPVEKRECLDISDEISFYRQPLTETFPLDSIVT
jgi:hypothetical protein